MAFNENSKPIYLQICDKICDEVMSGAYPPGSRLPSVREYAAQLQVNPNTMMRAYEQLSAQAIIYNKRGIGFFVTDDAAEQICQLRQSTFFNDEILYFFSRLENIGTTPDQLAALYNKYLTRQK